MHRGSSGPRGQDERENNSKNTGSSSSFYSRLPYMVKPYAPNQFIDWETLSTFSDQWLRFTNPTVDEEFLVYLHRDVTSLIYALLYFILAIAFISGGFLRGEESSKVVSYVGGLLSLLVGLLDGYFWWHQDSSGNGREEKASRSISSSGDDDHQDHSDRSNINNQRFSSNNGWDPIGAVNSSGNTAAFSGYSGGGRTVMVVGAGEDQVDPRSELADMERLNIRKVREVMAKRRWIISFLQLFLAALTTDYLGRQATYNEFCLDVTGWRGKPEGSISPETLNANCAGTFSAFTTYTLAVFFPGRNVHTAMLIPAMAFSLLMQWLVEFTSPRSSESLAATDVAALIIFALSIVGVTFARHIARRRAAMSSFKQEISLARSRTMALRRQEEVDTLLCNLLPLSALDRLVRRKPVSDYAEEATVLFSDVKGFTAWSSKRTAREVVEMLHIICLHCDQAATQCKVEKIKTIGDAYWAVSGIPNECYEHALRIVNFGHAMLKIFEEQNKLHPEWEDVSVRIGVHSGPLNGGMMGTQQLSYEVFGDTSTIAAKVEQAGIPGQVCISEDTMFFLEIPPHAWGPVTGYVVPPEGWTRSFQFPATTTEVQPMMVESSNSVSMSGSEMTPLNYSTNNNIGGGSGVVGGGTSVRSVVTNASNKICLPIPSFSADNSIQLFCLTREQNEVLLSGGEQSFNASFQPGDPTFALGGSMRGAGAGLATSLRSRGNNNLATSLRGTSGNHRNNLSSSRGGTSPDLEGSMSKSKRVKENELLKNWTGNEAKKRRMEFLKFQAVNSQGESSVTSETLEGVTARYSKRKYRYVFPEFKNEKIEAEFQASLFQTQKGLHRVTRVCLIFMHFLVLMLIGIQSGGTSFVASVPSLVLLCISGLVGLIDAGLSLCRTTSSFYPRVQAVLMLITSYSLVVACGLMPPGSSIATNFIVPIETVIVQLALKGNIGFVSVATLQIVNIFLFLPTTLFFTWDSAFFGTGVVFLVVTIATDIFAGVVLEKQYRAQFLQNQVATYFKTKQDQRRAEQQALLQSMVPHHVVKDLLDWMQTGMDPRKTIVETLPPTAVGFIQIDTSGHKSEWEKREKEIAAVLHSNSMSGGELIPTSQSKSLFQQFEPMMLAGCDHPAKNGDVNRKEENSHDDDPHHPLPRASIVQDLDAFNSSSSSRQSGSGRNDGSGNQGGGADDHDEEDEEEDDSLDALSIQSAQSPTKGGTLVPPSQENGRSDMAGAAPKSVKEFASNVEMSEFERGAKSKNSNTDELQQQNREEPPSQTPPPPPVQAFVAPVSLGNHWLQDIHEQVDTILKTFSDYVVKIKTVGDVVMIAGPFRSAQDAPKFKKIGGSMVDITRTRAAEKKALKKCADKMIEFVRQLQEVCTIRAGLHVGELVAAILGTNRLCFDIFGDTVNTASRCMTSGPMGSVSVSKEFKAILPVLQEEDGGGAPEEDDDGGVSANERWSRSKRAASIRSGGAEASDKEEPGEEAEEGVDSDDLSSSDSEAEGNATQQDGGMIFSLHQGDVVSSSSAGDRHSSSSTSFVSPKTGAARGGNNDNNSISPPPPMSPFKRPPPTTSGHQAATTFGPEMQSQGEHSTSASALLLATGSPNPLAGGGHRRASSSNNSSSNDSSLLQASNSPKVGGGAIGGGSPSPHTPNNGKALGLAILSEPGENSPAASTGLSGATSRNDSRSDASSSGPPTPLGATAGQPSLVVKKKVVVGSTPTLKAKVTLVGMGGKKAKLSEAESRSFLDDRKVDAENTNSRRGSGRSAVGFTPDTIGSSLDVGAIQTVVSMNDFGEATPPGGSSRGGSPPPQLHPVKGLTSSSHLGAKRKGSEGRLTRKKSSMRYFSSRAEFDRPFEVPAKGKGTIEVHRLTAFKPQDGSLSPGGVGVLRKETSKSFEGGSKRSSFIKSS